MTQSDLIDLLKSVVAAGALAKPILDAVKANLPAPVYVVASWILAHGDCLTELLDRLQAEVFSTSMDDNLAEISTAVAECRDCCPAVE